MPAARVSKLRLTAVNSILNEVRTLAAEGRKSISLMRGEPDFHTPEYIVEAGILALRNGRTGYPNNQGEIGLRTAVAEKLLRDDGLTYDPGAEILITDGATLGICVALMATLDEGDEVLVPDPVYDAYRSPVRLAGGFVRPARARFENGRFHLDVEALEAAWTPAVKALILNTPWNPVGTVFTSAELEAIADFVIRRNILLISDEIFSSELRTMDIGIFRPLPPYPKSATGRRGEQLFPKHTR